MPDDATTKRNELIQRFVRDRGHFLGFLRVLCRDGELAEELFQELSLAVIEGIDNFDSSRDFGAWARGIARNLYRKAVARRDRRLRDQLAYDPALVDAALAAYEGRSAEEDRTHGAHAQRLKHCIDQLPERHRKMLSDRYACGLAMARIAELHGRTVSAIETALCRIRAALLQCVRRGTEVDA